MVFILDLELALYHLGVLSFTHFVMIFHKKIPIILKFVMRKLIPFEASKIINSHFSFKKAKSYISGNEQKKWSHQSTLRVLILMRKDNNHFPDGLNNQLHDKALFT